MCCAEVEDLAGRILEIIWDFALVRRHVTGIDFVNSSELWTSGLIFVFVPEAGRE